MANENDKESRSARRPTTIELKAGEFKTSETAEQTPPEPDAAARPEQVSAPQMAASATADEPEPGRPEPAREQVARDSVPTPRPSSISWSLIAASIIGAVAIFAGGIFGGHWLSREMAQTAPVPVQMTAAQPAVSPELLERLAKLEAAAAAPRTTDPQLIARIAAAEASAKAVAEMAAARERRNDEIAAIANEAKERATSAASAADEASQKARTSVPEQSRAELEAVVARLAAIETVTRANEAELAKRANAHVDDARSRLAIAALSLRNAVDSGLPFSGELAALRALSGDPKSIAALEPFAGTGVPTTASLSRELQAAMPAIWKAARADEVAEGSLFERLKVNAAKIVRIRPAGEAKGDDAESVKARLELRAGSGDIRGALAELSRLPQDAQAPAQAWIKKAEARLAAIAAAQTLSQSALSALAKPGS